MKHLIFLLFFLPTTMAWACGNDYEEHITSNGKISELETWDLKAKLLERGFDIASLQAKRKYLIELFNSGKGNFRDSSDYALAEMKLGNAKTAVPILEKLNKQYPNEYNIAANLGTAYELVGENKLAHDFIKRALELNPESHRGSEWIHLKILEEKMKSNPDYKKIMNLQVKDLKSAFSSYNSKDSLELLFDLRNQLLFQLQERIRFIKPTDPIVSQLLIDVGDLMARTISVETAEGYYKLALEYGPENEEVIDDRLGEVHALLRYKFIKLHWGKILSFVIFSALIVWTIRVIILRRRKNKNKPSNTKND